MSARKEKPKTLRVLKVTHVRRCHVCGTVNESEASVNIKCHDCGKHLAPFYYFDESKMEGLSDTGLYLSQFKSAPDFNPIYGFSHYWVDEVGDESDNLEKEKTNKDSASHEGQSGRHQKSKRSSSQRHSRNRNR